MGVNAALKLAEGRVQTQALLARARSLLSGRAGGLTRVPTITLEGTGVGAHSPVNAGSSVGLSSVGLSSVRHAGVGYARVHHWKTGDRHCRRGG